MPRSAVAVSLLVTVQFGSFLALRMTADGGDPFDSPLYWWTWVLWPALAFGAARRLPHAPPILWCAAVVVPFAAEVAWLGAVAHDPNDGATVWLGGGLFAVAQSGMVLGAACAGTVRHSEPTAGAPSWPRIRRAALGAFTVGATFGAAAFGAFRWWDRAERAVCTGIFATCMNESFGRFFWLAVGLAWLALAAALLVRVLGVVRPALVVVLAMPAHAVAAVTVAVPGPRLVAAVMTGAIVWTLAGLATAAASDRPEPCTEPPRVGVQPAARTLGTPSDRRV